MNLKLVKKNEAVDLEEVSRVSVKLGLPFKFVELLYSRGIVGEQAINDFLYPDEKNFNDPFLMKGMTEAVERLNGAISAGEKIVVYGDYDADGICAAAILSLYLAYRGVEVYTHIPSRITEGYGLNTESIEKIIEDCNPDLILTCDCGISAYKEVEDAHDLGVDVIVTDHHEVSDKIPDCTVINPHQSDCNYPFKSLCGAGVALKLVEALGGREASNMFIDLAAVATIADLVPLTGENRLIVQLGLKDTYKIKNIGLKRLLESQKIDGSISSSDIAFKIAPRINAAGRMGDAYSAFMLLTTDDIKKIDEIIEDINENNIRRKNVCTRLYEDAIADLRNENVVDRRCIILSHPEWEKGITGIVAARLAGEFNRPSFILVKSGDAYKGTARSIENINIYTLLTEVSDLLVEFGGHSQAAGFSIREENIEKFKDRVTEYLADFPREFFEPALKYDIEIRESEIDMRLVNCLDLMEPTGNSNTKPLFRIDEDKLKIQPCKSSIMHTQITLPGNLQILAFNNYNKNQFLTTDGLKSIVIELQAGNFNGKDYIRGLLRGISIEKLTFGDELAGALFIKMAALHADEEPEYQTYSLSELDSLAGDNLYGTLVICGSKHTYDKFSAAFKNLVLSEFMFASVRNNYSRIIVSPEFDDNLWFIGYDKIIFLDRPINFEVISYINKNSKAKVYIPDCVEYNIMKDVSLERDVFAYYYDVIKRYKDIKSQTLWGYYKTLSARSQIGLRQFITCLIVFVDLDFISIQSSGEFAIKLNRDVKADLNSSDLYRKLCEYKGS